MELASRPSYVFTFVRFLSDLAVSSCLDDSLILQLPCLLLFRWMIVSRSAFIASFKRLSADVSLIVCSKRMTTKFLALFNQSFCFMPAFFVVLLFISVDDCLLLSAFLTSEVLKTCLKLQLNF